MGAAPKQKLTNEQIQAIKYELTANYRYGLISKLARDHKVYPSTIFRIKEGRLHAKVEIEKPPEKGILAFGTGTDKRFKFPKYDFFEYPNEDPKEARKRLRARQKMAQEGKVRV